MADTNAVESNRANGAWAVRDVRLRVLVLALTIATLVHGPLVPLRVFGWLRLLLRMTTEEPITDEDTEVIIPIELDPDPGSLQAPASAPPAEEPQPGPLQALEEPDPTMTPIVADAGVPEPETADAGEPDADAPDAGMEETDAGPPPPDAAAPVAQADAGAGTPPGGRVRDPFAVAGDPGAVKPEHPNVRVYIAADSIRNHPVGPMFSELLTMIPEWSEVLSGTGIDPMKNFDHVLLSGPQFRDPSLVVAVMDFNVSPARMREAVERAMRASRPPGQWLTGHGLATASLGRDGYRRAVLLPDKRLFVLLPASAEDQIPRLAKMKPFRQSGEQCLVLYLITPWRAFRGTGFALPERIRWLRLAMTPVDTAAGPGAGGYVIDIEAEDESAEAAAEDAKELFEALEDVRVLDLIIKKVEIVGRPTYEVDGKMIRAQAPVSVEQVERIIKHMKGWMKERAKIEGRAAPAPKRKAASRGPRPTSSGAVPRPRPVRPRPSATATAAPSP